MNFGKNSCHLKRYPNSVDRLQPMFNTSIVFCIKYFLSPIYLNNILTLFLDNDVSQLKKFIRLRDKFLTDIIEQFLPEPAYTLFICEQMKKKSEYTI